MLNIGVFPLLRGLKTVISALTYSYYNTKIVYDFVYQPVNENRQIQKKF